MNTKESKGTDPNPVQTFEVCDFSGCDQKGVETINDYALDHIVVCKRHYWQSRVIDAAILLFYLGVFAVILIGIYVGLRAALL